MYFDLIILQQFAATLGACVLLCLAVWTYRIGVQWPVFKTVLDAQNPKTEPPKNKDETADVIRLVNGNTVRGRIISAQGEKVILHWEGGTVAFAKTEIKTMEWAKPAALAHETEVVNWPYRNNPILRLTNRHVLDGQIVEVRDEYVVLREELKTDSYIEYQIQRDRIEAIEFNASNTGESSLIQRCLMTQFPKLGQYETLMKYARSFYSRTPIGIDEFRPGIIGRIWNAISRR